jgi:hypothetical protein
MSSRANAKNIVVEEFANKNITASNMPRQYVTVGQCCAEADRFDVSIREVVF